MENSITETIGCDLGDKMSEVCVLGADGAKQRMSLRTTRVAMRLFFTRAPAHVVVEVGGHSRWVSALLAELGHRVTVANARRVQQRPPRSRSSVPWREEPWAQPAASRRELTLARTRVAVGCCNGLLGSRASDTRA
jgi:hypothetical protein